MFECSGGITMQGFFFISVGCLLIASARAVDDVEPWTTIPPNFYIGVGTSSYQIEGGWNASDKGVNVWDFWTHEKPWVISDGTNGDIACDSYHKYKEDVAFMKDLGLDHYRFSLSWSRILPNGFANVVSKDGIQYYKNLLDELKAAGIEPMVTIYHWDHPQILEDLGGWTNDLMAKWFADYARVVFKELGDRVKVWATLNEPDVVCRGGYQNGDKAPGKKILGLGPYMCLHNMLKGHALAYTIYREEFRQTQGGKVGIVLPCGAHYPLHANDTVSPDINFQFDCGWMAHPIFSEKGDYPAIMKERIAENSKIEGYPFSRLPEFTPQEIESIRGTADFFGLNHYTSVLVESVPRKINETWYDDRGVKWSYNATWPGSGSKWLKVVPQGLGDTVRKLKSEYNNPLVYVTENGVSDRDASPVDIDRIQYLHDYLRELLIAINRDGCNVKAYTVWSLMDNFEWERGYNERFGLISIKYNEPERTRVPKLSYFWMKELIKTRKLPAPM